MLLKFLDNITNRTRYVFIELHLAEPQLKTISGFNNVYCIES